MNSIQISEDISLIPYYPTYETALAWYQDKTLCKQVDDIDTVYTLEKLIRMYNYLNAHGDLFYIACQGQLCGDVCLQDSGELAIVICKEFQNRHIGRAVIRRMLTLAAEKGFKQCFAHIYSFNIQSQQMFKSLGFTEEGEELYVYQIKI